MLQLLGQRHALARPGQRLVGAAHLPQRPGRVAQAHHAGVLHRGGAVAALAVVGQAAVGQRHGLGQAALVEQDVGVRPAGLQAGLRLGVVAQAGGHFVGDGLGAGEVAAHEVVALQPQAQLVQRRLVAQAAGQHQRTVVDGAHLVGAVALGGDQQARQQQLQAQLGGVAVGPGRAVLSIGPVWCRGRPGQQGQRALEVRRGFVVGAAAGGMAGGALPAGQGFGPQAGLLLVQGQQLGLAVAQRGKVRLQHRGNGRMQPAPVTLEHALVGGVAHQRMAEGVQALLALLLGRQQAGLHQGLQQRVERGQVDGRGGMRIHRLDQRLRKHPAQRAAHLCRALGLGQLVEPGGQQVLQGAGHGVAQHAGDVVAGPLGRQRGGHAGRFLDEQRHAVGPGGQPFGQRGVVQHAAAGTAQQVLRGLGAQAAQAQHRHAEAALHGVVGAAAQRQQQQHPLAARAGDQPVHQFAGGRVGPLHVFQDQAHRRLVGQHGAHLGQQVHRQLAAALG